MKSRSSRWVSGIGAVLVGGGVLIAGYGGSGVMPAGAAVPASNPISAILAKLDQILAALTSAAGAGNHTLRWDQALPAAQRFVVLAAFANAAVLDQNTGLVWEQSPETTIATQPSATNTCINKNVGGQKGWRLPSIPELASLIDPTVAVPGPTLPAGHPFTAVQSSNYWSATADAFIPTDAWGVNFRDGVLFEGGKTSGQGRWWCVRGPMQESVY